MFDRVLSTPLPVNLMRHYVFKKIIETNFVNASFYWGLLPSYISIPDVFKGYRNETLA